MIDQDAGGQTVLVGGGSVGRIHASWPFIELTITRSIVVIQGRILAPVLPVTLDRDEVAGIFIHGRRIRFHTHQGVVEKVTFVSLRPKQAQQAFHSLGWPVHRG